MASLVLPMCRVWECPARLSGRGIGRWVDVVVGPVTLPGVQTSHDRKVSSSHCVVAVPSDLFVVFLVVSKAAVEDADESV